MSNRRGSWLRLRRREGGPGARQRGPALCARLAAQLSALPASAGSGICRLGTREPLASLVPLPLTWSFLSHQIPFHFCQLLWKIQAPPPTFACHLSGPFFLGAPVGVLTRLLFPGAPRAERRFALSVLCLRSVCLLCVCLWGGREASWMSPPPGSRSMASMAAEAPVSPVQGSLGSADARRGPAGDSTLAGLSSGSRDKGQWLATGSVSEPSDSQQWGGGIRQSAHGQPESHHGLPRASWWGPDTP